MKLTETEFRFMEIVWANEPISSRDLVMKCEDSFGWKKSTTYTFLSRLQNKEILTNKDSIVESIVSKKDARKSESFRVVDNSFNGSLPNFVTSFLENNKLSKKEYQEILDILNSYKDKLND